MSVLCLSNAPVAKKVSGVETYFEDFENVVIPELTKCGVTYIRGYTVKRQAILGFHYLQPPLHSVEDRDTKVYQILHNDIKIPIMKWLRAFKKNHRFVTHYTWFWRWMKEKELKAFFIPMSIDTSKLPYKEKRNGKIICFTNVWHAKELTYNKIKEQGIKFDTMSMGVLTDNDGEYIHKQEFTQEESFEIVSEYEYGIGVGRSALEMLAMGLKVIVAGKEYSGPIRNHKDLTDHWAINCNSTVVKTSGGNIKEDFKGDFLVVEKEHRKVFDMRNYINLYKQFFEVN